MGKKGFFDVVEYCECGCDETVKQGRRFINGHNRRKEKPLPKLCKCGCGDFAKSGNTFVFGHGRRKEKPLPKLCACGCGEFAKPGRKFAASGHSRRGRNKPRVTLFLDDAICDYGCGRKAYFQFNNGKVCCENSPVGCSKARKALSEKTIGKVFSLCQRKNVSLAKKKSIKRIGLISEAGVLCEYGCGGLAYYRFKSGKACCCKTVIGCFATRFRGKKGHKSWCEGLTKRDDLRLAKASEKKAETFNNRIRLDLNVLCQYGCGQQAQYRFNNGKVCCSNYYSKCPAVIDRIVERLNHPEIIRILSERMKGESNPAKRPEARRKIRIAKINKAYEQITEGGQVRPFYNSRSCKFFEKFDFDFNTQGRYATNSGEYYIKELGYWTDYINFDLRLIIEWDEEFHYSTNGKLRKKDILRQKEIQEHFPDFRFVRIREKFQEEEVDCLLKGLRRRK